VHYSFVFVVLYRIGYAEKTIGGTREYEGRRGGMGMEREGGDIIRVS
jgi:hypothetical protein